MTEANLCSVGCRGMVEGYKHISEPIPRSKQNIILTSRSRKKRSQGIKLLKLRNKNFFNLFSVPHSNTVVGDYINTMKTTFDFNFDLYQAFTQHRYTKNGNKEKLSIKKASLSLLVNL